MQIFAIKYTSSSQNTVLGKQIESKASHWANPLKQGPMISSYEDWIVNVSGMLQEVQRERKVESKLQSWLISLDKFLLTKQSLSDYWSQWWSFPSSNQGTCSKLPSAVF